MAVQMMGKLSWNESFSVGVKKFDDQHKVLFGYLNELYDAMRDKKEKDVVGPVLEKLLSYTLTHFFDEEIALYRTGYSGYARHKEAHDILVSTVRDYYIRFRSDSEPGRKILIEIIAVLTDWLNEHIGIVDKSYSAWLNSNGVK